MKNQFKIKQASTFYFTAGFGDNFAKLQKAVGIKKSELIQVTPTGLRGLMMYQ